MNGSQCHQLLNEPAPKNFASWVYQALLASFDISTAIDLAPHAVEYVEWVASLPTTTERTN